MATGGDLNLATSRDVYMATDNPQRHARLPTQRKSPAGGSQSAVRGVVAALTNL